MSEAPADPGPQTAAEEPQLHPRWAWFQRATSVLFVIFCFELGLFLLIYPWTGAWTDNYFAWAIPGAQSSHWTEFWNNGFVRGAVSGLGVLDLWVALIEVFRLFAKRRAAGKNGL